METKLTTHPDIRQCDVEVTPTSITNSNDICTSCDFADGICAGHWVKVDAEGISTPGFFCKSWATGARVEICCGGEDDRLAIC